jgi:purine-nucleoside phosphorylase
MPVKMNPIAPAAADAILVGDPRRAFDLAQVLTVQPKMSHQARGLWGYSGITVDGLPLTVQSTGSGGPSAVPVIGDLVDQGVSRIIRLGTCLAIDPGLRAGTLLLVERAVVADGAGRLLSGGDDFTRPDPDLLAALDGLGRTSTVSSHDLVSRYEPDGQQTADPGPAIARDLQSAATLAFCRRLDVPAAALLIVAEDTAGARLGEEEIWDLFRTAGKAVLSRLNRLSNPQVEG